MKVYPVILLFLGATLLLSTGHAIAQEVTFVLNPVGTSGISATGRVTAAAGGNATLEVNATGLTANSRYRVTLHTGTCAAAGASSGLLGEITADTAGRATLSAGALTLLGSGQTTPLSFSSLTDGQHLVVIGSAADPSAAGSLACGSIPGSAGGLPATGGSAGADSGAWHLLGALAGGAALVAAGAGFMRAALSRRPF
jgi:hypothetical protein